jgi:hypothetical protein
MGGWPVSDEQCVSPDRNGDEEVEVFNSNAINEKAPVDGNGGEWFLPWQKGKNSNVYEREKLYDEVWAKPVVHVAVQYGVSGTAIKKVCKALNVPVPPRGHWAKLKAGKGVKKIPLPESEGHNQFIGSRTHTNPLAARTAKEPLAFLPEEERQQVIAASMSTSLAPENARLHKNITAYKAVVTDWNKNDRKAEGAQRKYSNYFTAPPFLAGVIAKETLPRVYCLLDALYRQVENLGGSVNDDLTLKIRGETVGIEIYEGQDKVKHEITREEAKAVLLYEDSRKHGGWVSEPQIRKHDYIFNGLLRLCISKGNFYKDTEKMKLESRLGEILIGLYEESELLRIEHIKREEETRKQAEKERQRLIFNEKYDKEVEKTLALGNAALDYEKAVRIRAYINAVASSYGTEQIGEETATWLKWAKDKADWFDPIKARQDEYFGKRLHENDEGRKILKKNDRYW